MRENRTCPACGVEISNTPEKHGLHKVQMATPVPEGEEYCEACAFQSPEHGEYTQTGKHIIKS